MSQQDLEDAISALRRAVRLALYGCLLGLLAGLAIGLGNVAYSGHLDDRQRREARADATAREVVQRQTTQLVCDLAVAQSEAFQDATSPAGQKSRDAWIALAHRFNCIP